MASKNLSELEMIINAIKPKVNTNSLAVYQSEQEKIAEDIKKGNFS